ncbi:carbohydrate ABC transporter permease [Streptomyces gilvus]|uniref:carbohydrate ABC transporter permease n=1 Tax=Streptomyces gilvus TaxID=2920937 RepID=UPI001F0F7657|nr:sugar ABC transporter permease [Streptomyces sp. CME 23]MCH5676615.1 sugar ABC transporter permease [Streptomyces sp. CME 23]
MSLLTSTRGRRGLPAAAAAAAAGPPRRRWRRYPAWKFYAFVSPWVIGCTLLTAVPIVYALGLSFTDYDGMSSNWSWVGFANYTAAFHDDTMWSSLLQTGLYALLVVPLSLAGGLGLAVLLNQRLRAVGVLRTIFYLPSIVPVVATALMFKLIFDRDTGLVNGVLGWFGIPATAWLNDPTSFLVLVLLALWGMGGGMVIFLAGLQGIPAELMESASVDGAGALRRFWHITLPMLSPMIFFQLVLTLITTLQALSQPLLLAPSSNGGAGGGVTDATHVQQGDYLYMVNVYAQFFNYQKYGYGAALLWILFVVILAITVLVLRSGSFWVYYEVDQDGGEE